MLLNLTFQSINSLCCPRNGEFSEILGHKPGALILEYGYKPGVGAYSFVLNADFDLYFYKVRLFDVSRKTITEEGGAVGNGPTDT